MRLTLATAIVIAGFSTAYAQPAPPSGVGAEHYPGYLEVVKVLESGKCSRDIESLRYWSRGDVLGSMKTFGFTQSEIDLRAKQWDRACGKR